MRLLESNATTRRARGGTAASILVHVSIIGAAVVATANAKVAEHEKPIDRIVYVAPARPTPPASTSRAPSTRSTSATGAPTAAAPLPEAPMPDLSKVRIGIPPVTPGLDPLRGLAEAFERGGVVRSGGASTDAPSGDGPWTENLVERVAVPLGAVRARYPDALRAAGIGGRAVLRFVVDTLGRVEPATVEIASATDPRFGDAARRAIGGLRFRPAEAGGRRVRQLVELPFEFVLQ